MTIGEPLIWLAGGRGGCSAGGRSSWGFRCCPARRQTVRRPAPSRRWLPGCRNGPWWTARGQLGIRFVLVAAADQRQAARLMVRGDDHQRMSILQGKPDGGLHCLIEEQGLPNCAAGLVGVALPVDLAALDHEEKARFAVSGVRLDPAEQLNRLACELGETRFRRDGFQAFELKQAQHVGPAQRLHRFGCLDVFVAGVPGGREQVEVVFAAALRGGLGQEELLAPAEQDVHPVGDQLLGDLVLHLAALDVGGEAGGRRMADRGRHHQTRGHAFVLGGFEDRAIPLLLGAHSDHAVLGLDAAGQGGPRGGRVRHGGIGRMGPDQAGHRQLLQAELAIQPGRFHPCHCHLGQTHAVADTEDHVIDALARGLQTCRRFRRGLIEAQVVGVHLGRRRLGRRQASAELAAR